MKKITFWLFALMALHSTAQVGITQSFPNTTTPIGWDIGAGFLTTTQACATSSWRVNLYGGDFGVLSGTLRSEAQISNGADLTISFDYKVVNWSLATVATNPFNGNIITEVSIDNGTTWTVTAGTINNANHVVGNTCTNVTYVVPGASVPTGSNVRIRWRCNFGTSGDYYVYLDNISATQPTSTPPLCTTLTSPANGAINVSSTVISWAPASGIPSGYKLNVGSTSGGTDVLNNFDAGNVLSYTLPPLDLSTTYFVTVIPYNANGDAVGCTETSFSTCDEFGDFSENFDALTAAGQIPACWSRLISGGAGTPTVGASTTNNSAPYSIALTNSSSTATANIMLISPYVNNLAAGTNRLKFFARNNNDTQDIVIGTITNPSDATTFTPLQTVDINGTFQEYSVSFAGYTGTDNYIAIRRLSTATFSTVFIDNVVWEVIPTVAPSCVTITSPADGATNVFAGVVSWSSNADATGYRISVGISPGATDVLNLFDVGNVLSYTIDTDPGTDYFVTVYPYNSFGQATGCTEISFSTCDPLVPEITETFTTIPPTCWANRTGGDLTSGPTTTLGTRWVADGFANNGTTGALKFNIFVATANDWFISPVVSIPAAGYELRFAAAATQWGQTVAPTTAWEADDFVQVLVSTNGLSNWTVLTTFDASNVPPAAGSNYIFDLDAYAGQDVRFAFRTVEGAADGGADIDFFIDNFNVRLTPSSVPDCATNIVATPDAACGNFANTITWTAATGADGYNLTIGTTPGGTDVLNNQSIGNVLTYSFSGTVNTTYYYTIVPFNGTGPSVGCVEQSFTTNANGCYCTSAPTSVDGTGITNIQIGTTNFPNTVSTQPVYSSNVASPVDMSQGINNNVQITFNVPSFGGNSYDYNTVIWIDFNDDFTFDATEIVFSGLSTTVGVPTLLNASFVMPLTAPLGQHRMRVVATDVAQTPSNPCYSGTFGETVDFTVNIVEAPCTPATVASSTIVSNCANNQFNVSIDVTSLGDGTPVITDGSTTWPVSSTGVIVVGPFTSGSSINLVLQHGSDATCNLSLGTFTFTCPPANDLCENAISLTPGAVFSTNPLVGTNVGATVNSSDPVPACDNFNFATNGKDVWYTVVVPASGSITVETNNNSDAGMTDTGLEIYSGTCGALTLVECNADGSTDGNFSIISLTNRTEGEVLLIRVWGYNTNAGSFQVSAYDASLSANNFNNNNFSAYPNPVKDLLNLAYTSEISDVRVVNMLGQVVLTKKLNANNGQLDVSQLSAGTYIVNVTIGDTVKTIKVVKQ